MKIELDLAGIERAAIETAKKEAHIRATKIIGEHLYLHYHNGQCNIPPTPGFGYIQIREAIDNYLTSPEYNNKLNYTIKKHMDEMLDEKAKEACSRAINKATHLAAMSEVNKGK